MRFIDKFSDITGQVALTEDWVDEHWIQDEGRYANLSYHIRRPAVFIRHLHFQQESLCCYCMKSLLEDGSDSTIEHIVPQGGEVERPQDREAFNQYLDLPVLDPLVERVSYKWDFVRNRRIQRGVTSLPHDVHLLNMVLSCDSKAHCNHVRGDRFIEPIFFYPDVEQNLDYNREGDAGSVKQVYQELIETVNLNESELRTIRALWANCHLIAEFTKWSQRLLEEIGHILFGRTRENRWSVVATDYKYQTSLLLKLEAYRYFESHYNKS